MYADGKWDMATAAVPLVDEQDIENPSVVKVVWDCEGRALYFSRSVIPHDRDSTGSIEYFKHVGLYAYSCSFVQTYIGLSPTVLEQSEHLEQLRALEHGYRIGVRTMATSHHGIDTPEQYRAFVERWRASQSG